MWRRLSSRCAAVMQTIRTLPQPVIAEVQGTAVAAGCQLVASCDMAVAADHARFGVNGVNIGLFCSTPMVALSRAVPPKAAFEMLTTGRLIDAEEAVRLGLINRAVPAEALRAATADLAGTLAAKLSSAVRVGKRAFYEQAELGEAEAYAHTGAVMTANMPSVVASQPWPPPEASTAPTMVSAALVAAKNAPIKTTVIGWTAVPASS